MNGNMSINREIEVKRLGEIIKKVRQIEDDIENLDKSDKGEPLSVEELTELEKIVEKKLKELRERAKEKVIYTKNSYSCALCTKDHCPNSLFCDDHKCMNSGCVTSKHRDYSRYCMSHECIYPRCLEPRIINDPMSEYCDTHDAAAQFL